MGYIIEPMPLISFLDEANLKLPRFQRKATWDKKQNFELAVSIFQDYPVGVVIINQEQRASWLLDGRQRRNALITMRSNPVELYEWARNYIGFNKTADEREVRISYWEKVDRYLFTEERDSTQATDSETNIYSEEPEDLPPENSFNSTRQRLGLQTLLDIILMVHQNKPNGSKWEITFDFSEYFQRLKYTPSKNNGRVDPVLLRRFLLDLIKSINHDYDGSKTQKNFVDYYLQNFDVIDQNKFEKDLDKKWPLIISSIETIAKSEKIFNDARIGVIRLTNATPLDAQNIFSRINKGGTQLKAEELLSAKPYWNREVNTTDPTAINQIKEMYANLGIPFPETIVRWDIAATLISRMKDKNLLFDTYAEVRRKKEVSMEEITLGFKLLSTVFVGGMSGRHVIDLENNNDIDWTFHIDELVDNINTICNIITEDSFFKFFLSWHKPLTKLLGNAITLEFISILLLDWKDKNKPRYSISGEMRALSRDARILFDRMVFEYATRTWRGSGDSKMSTDIKNWRTRILPVNENDWLNLIEGGCEGYYNGQPTTIKLLRPVLYYYYALTDTLGERTDATFDVDHLIPQETFTGNNVIDQNLKESLINLALLPSKDNNSKKAKKLNEISDSWLRQQIKTYTGLTDADFEKYSNIANISLLKEQRQAIYCKVFREERNKMLSR
jgi:hypothetical protein